MKVDLPAKFRGTYEFTLTHKDGSVEKVVTHNIVCQGIRSASSASTLYFGKGSGTPAFTDSGVFSSLWSVSVTSNESIKAVGDNGARVVIQYDVPASSSYVGTITEVSLGGWTHAMLADAEGNPISIVKTDTDLLTVIVTIELYITSAVPLVHGWSRGVTEFVENFAVVWLGIVTGFRYSGNNVPWKGMTAIPKNILAPGDSYSNGSTSTTISVAGVSPGTLAWGSYTCVGNLRYTTDGFNGHYYRYLQFLWGGYYNKYMWESRSVHGIALGMDLKNPDVFGTQPFIGVAVGTGDGATTDFACPLNYFKKDTDVLYKNGVALTRNVDYTIEHCANKDRLQELTHWVVSDPDNIKITGATGGSYWQFAPVSTSASYDPEYVCKGFSEDVPLHIDWGEENKCNHLRGTVYAYYVSEMIVEYSEDDKTWIPVTSMSVSTNTNTSFAVDLTWEAITARYWRIRVTRYGTDLTKEHKAYFNGSAFFGNYNPKGIHFMTAPAEGDLITMDCQSDIPFKNENFVFNLSLDIALNFS